MYFKLWGSRNGVQENISVDKRSEIRGGWRKLQNEVHNLCMNDNELAEYVACIGTIINIQSILVGRPNGKR